MWTITYNPEDGGPNAIEIRGLSLVAGRSTSTSDAFVIDYIRNGRGSHLFKIEEAKRAAPEPAGKGRMSLPHKAA